LFAPEIAGRIKKRSAAERRKIMDYLRPWLDSGGVFGVCDIGYNATAQMQLKRIFEMEGSPARMVGCYLVATEMAARRVLDGLDVRHFLGAFGHPGFNHFAFLRSPAFVEQSLVSGCGTTLGYERTPDGTVHPVLDEMRFPAELLRRQHAFKEGILHYQKLWLHFRAQKPGLLDGSTDLSRRLLADIDLAGSPILARAAAFPTQNEVAHFAALPLDDCYFAGGFQTISGTKDCEFVRTKGYAAALANQGVLWPQAASAQINPKAAGEFFSYAKGMLLCRPDRDNDGVQPALTVIVRAAHPEKLRAILGQAAQNVRAGFDCEIILLLNEGDKNCITVAEEFASAVRRLHCYTRSATQTLAQLLNLAADIASAPLLLFLDDSARLAEAWNQSLLAAFDAGTGAILGTLDAGCLAIRRVALAETLGYAEKISPAAAHWKMLLAARELGWQIKSCSGLVAEADPQKISAEDRRMLKLWFPDFEKAAAGITAQRTPPAVALPPPTRLVSIIILALNQLKHTRACLESIAAHTPSPHEVIVVDNGSTDDTPAFLKSWQAEHANCTVICNESNRGFAAGNNQALAVARGEYILLLNNDTVVTAGWLEAMLAVYARHPETGLVGPVSNQVSGPQLVREAVYENLAEMHEFAKGYVGANAGESFEVVRAVGFCLLATRAVITKIGGLDETFGSGNFEDDDFCLRARFAGFHVRIARDAFVHHAGSQTFAGEKIDYRVSMLRNWDIFRTKWQLPAETTLEKGYPIPQHLPTGLALNLPLPVLTATHDQNGGCWMERKKTGVASMPAKAATVTHIGRLDEARELLKLKKLEAAWEAGLTAIARRPFHPEAFFLLAEIALAAGAGRMAKQYAQRARDLAPGWKPVKQFLCQSLKGDAKPEWMVLPDLVSNSKAQTPSRLSICLIVKNEERFLAQCLKSVRGLAAQIVVVDTGSTDRTVEIAREFGAEIYSFGWCDDFGAARNAALEHATGEWVLMLDADEELPAAQHARLLADMKNAAAIAFRLPLVNAGQENEGRSFVPRLFRNAPGVFFAGRIHEQVFSSLLERAKLWGLKTALGSAELLHHGYTQEILRDRNKIERNLKLLGAAIAENPADPNLLMNLGLELVRSNNLAAGVEKYREAYEQMSVQEPAEVPPELREVLLTQFTSQLYKVQNHEEVVRVLNSPLARRGGLTASLHFALGLAYFELKQFSETADQMRQCLTKRKQSALTPINTDILTAAPQHCLALCLVKLGDPPAAEKAFEAALAATGIVEAVRLDYAKFLRTENRALDALHQLHAIVTAHPKNLAAWQLGAEIALGQADYLQFARDWTGEACRALPENPALAGQCAEATLLTGDAAGAAQLWDKIWRSEPDPRTLAALILCATSAGQTIRPPSPGPDENATSLAFVAWYQKLIAIRAHPLIENINGRLEPLARMLPTAAQMLGNALGEVQTETTAAGA
jgi:GT2 family glycosyltransferase